MLAIADTDRGYYADHALTVARHPSETEERLMVRLFAFALHAAPGLGFGRGLSSDDEPDLLQQDETGAMVRWIDVGLPDPKWLRKAAARASEVTLVTYGARADDWWRQQRDTLARLPRLTVVALPAAQTTAFARLTRRSMRFDVNIGHQSAWFGSDDGEATLDWTVLQAPAEGR